MRKLLDLNLDLDLLTLYKEFDSQLDWSIYIEVIVGILTVHGIILAFDQYLMNDSTLDKFFCGSKLRDIYLNSFIPVRKIICKRTWLILVYFECLSYPVYRLIPNKVYIKLIEVIWLAVMVIIFMILFKLVFSCLTCLFKVGVNRGHSNLAKSYSDKQVERVSNIRFFSTQKLKKEIITLCDNRIQTLQKNYDENFEEYYDSMQEGILNEYLNKKQKRINNVSFLLKKNWGKPIVRFIWRICLYEEYVSPLEIQTITHIIDCERKRREKVNRKGTEFVQMLMRTLFAMIETECEQENIKDKIYNRIRETYEDTRQQSSLKRWFETVEMLYQEGSTDEKNTIINECVNMLYGREAKAINEYANELITSFINKESMNIFTDEMTEDDFLFIFSSIFIKKVYDDRFNHYHTLLAKNIAMNMLDANENDIVPEQILIRLNKQGRLYIFFYIIEGYSAYKFRFFWRALPKHLSALKKIANDFIEYDLNYWNHKYLDITEKEVEDIERELRKCNIQHRLKYGSVKKLLQYVAMKLDDSCIQRMYEDKCFDVSYMILIKAILFGQKYDSFNKGCIPIDLYFQIIEDIAQKPELLEYEELSFFVEASKYKYRREIRKKSDDEKKPLSLNLHMLLILELEITVRMYRAAGDSVYIYQTILGKDRGKFFLLNIEHPAMLNCEWMKKDIVNNFTLEDKSIDAYINDIEEECKKCKYALNLIKKEEMKRFLKQICGL